jgi:acetylglutamate kinase
MNIAIVQSAEQLDLFRTLLIEYGHSMAEPQHSSIWNDIATLPGRYAPPSGCALLGFVDGVLVGCAALSKVSASTVELKRVYVVAAQRGKNYGRTLTLAAMQQAKHMGYARVVLSSWEYNTIPIQMYRSMGYTEVAPFKQADYAQRLIFLGYDLMNQSPNPKSPVSSNPATPSHAPTLFKVSGSDLDDAAFSQRLAEIIAAQAKAGTKPILVHGGGKEITELSSALNIKTEFIDGLRVTAAPARDVALMVLSGVANKRMVAHILRAGANAVGLSGVDGGLIRVERINPALHFVGQPVEVNTALLSLLLNQNFVPVINPMSVDAGFEICNVNADHAAGAIAVALNARMLTFITNVPGVYNAAQSLISNLSATAAKALIADGTVNGGMIPKVRTCLEAIDNGVSLVRITNLDGLAHGTGTIFSGA